MHSILNIKLNTNYVYVQTKTFNYTLGLWHLNYQDVIDIIVVPTYYSFGKTMDNYVNAETVESSKTKTFYYTIWEHKT